MRDVDLSYTCINRLAEKIGEQVQPRGPFLKLTDNGETVALLNLSLVKEIKEGDSYGDTVLDYGDSQKVVPVAFNDFERGYAYKGYMPSNYEIEIYKKHIID